MQNAKLSSMEIFAIRTRIFSHAATAETYAEAIANAKKIIPPRR